MRLATDRKPDAWRRQGLCWPDPTLDGDELAAHVARWFPISYQRHGRPIPLVEQTRAVCSACPVQDQCLIYALDENERDGIWGGTTPRQRERMRGAA